MPSKLTSLMTLLLLGWSSASLFSNPIFSQLLLPEDLAQGEEFGWDCAIDGNLAIVGSKNGLRTRILYKTASNQWRVVKKITTGKKVWSVDVSGNTLVTTGSDSVEIYKWNGREATFYQSIKGFPFRTISVSIDGDTLAAGQDDHGQLYIYRDDGTSFKREAFITGPRGFGRVVAVSGDTVACSQMRLGTVAETAVYVYQRGAEGWTLQQTLHPPEDEGIATHHFGWSLALDGDLLAAGPINVDDKANAFAFHRQGTVWGTGQRITPSGDATSLGGYHSLQIEGDTLLAGAKGAEGRKGLVYQFSWTGNQWEESAELRAPDAAEGDGFGFAVSLDDESICICAHERNSLTGGAYFFDRKIDTDGDGLPDDVETNTGTFASEADTGTDPNNPDSDGDGLRDGEEVTNHKSNPNQSDTDADGFLDGFEVKTGFDPALKTSTPDTLSSIRTAVEFRFAAALGQSYRVEASTDLETWVEIENGIEGVGGEITRFYSTEKHPFRAFRARKE